MRSTSYGRGGGPSKITMGELESLMGQAHGLSGIPAQLCKVAPGEARLDATLRVFNTLLIAKQKGMDIVDGEQEAEPELLPPADSGDDFPG